MTGIQAAISAADIAQNSCVDAIRADPALADFSAHYPEYESRATASQIADPSRVTDAQRPTFSEVQRRIVGCRNSYNTTITAAMPEAAGIIAADAVAADRDWQAMTSGQITIGEGIARANDRQRRYNDQFASVRQQVEMQLQSSHAAEMQQRAAATAALGAVAAGLAAGAAAAAMAPRPYYCNRYGCFY